MSSDTATAETDEDMKCRFCQEPLDPEEPGSFKSPRETFAHRDCIADHCYDKREKVATTEGIITIKPVTIKKIVNGKETILESYWQAKCPICHQEHTTDKQSEEIRSELIDTVCNCCDIDWLAPSDWIEDCDICHTDHRESRQCELISFRDPFPSPENHTYDCADCDWNGEGDDFNNQDGYCPECESPAVKAIEKNLIENIHF